MERIWMWLAWHLPRSLAYWTAIRVGASATTGKYADREVPKVTVIDALEAWAPNGRIA